MRFKNKNLRNYFIYSIVISLALAFFIWFFLSICSTFLLYTKTVQRLLMSGKIASSIIVVYFINIIIIFGVFLVTFIRLVNPKIRYIKYISEQIQKIEKQGMDVIVDEIGDDELTQLSRSINSMSLRLKEKIEREKKNEQSNRELITNVSHDLRTPLTSIIGYIDLIKKNRFSDERKFDEYMEVVERRLNGLNLMINELFEYTKLESNDKPLELSSIDIIQPIRHIIKEYKIFYGKQNLNMISDININSCIIDVDYNKIIRVFQNLFDNAKKYAKENSDVYVKVYSKQGFICFFIENLVQEGLSLDIEKICNRFYKGNISRTCSDSSGLGLAIVKRIVELHGGNFNIEYNHKTISFLVELKSG